MELVLEESATAVQVAFAATTPLVATAGIAGSKPLLLQLKAGATETAAAMVASSTVVVPVTVAAAVLPQRTGLGTKATTDLAAAVAGWIVSRTAIAAAAAAAAEVWSSPRRHGD